MANRNSAEGIRKDYKEFNEKASYTKAINKSASRLKKAVTTKKKKAPAKPGTTVKQKVAKAKRLGGIVAKVAAIGVKGAKGKQQREDNAQIRRGKLAKSARLARTTPVKAKKKPVLGRYSKTWRKK